MKRALVVILLAAGTGCVKQPVAVYMDTQVDGETGHYVLIAAKGSGTLQVYDCLARPDGSRWNPTCVKADLRNEPGRTSD